MFKKILQKEIQRLKKNGSLYEEDGLRIYVLDTENKLPVNETELEDFAYGANVLKQDKGVLACKKQVGQRCFFFKKTFHKNKKFHHIFKYCFLPSRGFTNAAVSNQLIRNGIRTPKVFLCAERKKNIFSIPVILENSYMISEALDSKELSELIPQVLSDPRTVAQFLANWGGCIRKIHEAGVYHGDMKTSNFFFDKTENPNSDRLEKLEENIGVWDLDCSKIYEGSVPEKEKIRDVGRAFSSFLLVVDGLLGNSDSSGISKEDFSRKIPLFLIIFCESTETDLKKVDGKLFSYWFKNKQLKNIDLTYLKMSK